MTREEEIAKAGAGFGPAQGGDLIPLKCWPEFFDSIIRGQKPWEVRKNDRNFQVGDVLLLKEWKPGVDYTGRSIKVYVELVIDLSAIGCPGYVGMTIRPLAPGERQ